MVDVLGLLLAVPRPGMSQEAPAGVSYYAALKSQNLSELWQAANLYEPGGRKVFVPFPEPLGFIGPNYQRFYLHYTAVRQDAANPYLYHVAGKTRVKNNVCGFTGTITVLRARRYLRNETDYPQYQRGEVSCRVELAEDRQQPGSGTLRGELVSYWYRDGRGKLRYDVLEAGSDGFCNNLCTATWTSYATGQRKACHWGDFRIPESGPLDIGAGELLPDPKYKANGWQTYEGAFIVESTTPQERAAQAEERRKWWL